MNCGQKAQGVVLVAEEAPSTVTPWWTGASERPGAIPPPPQVREEVARAEAAQIDRARRDAERERRLQAAQEREERIRTERAERAKAALDVIAAANAPNTVSAAAASANVSSAPAPLALKAECERCGTPLKTAASGQGFSFCLHCGAEAPRPAATTVAPAAVATATSAGFGAPVFGPTLQATSGTQTVGQGRTVALAGTVAVAERTSVGVSPGLAAVLSFFLPGLGQLVNGQISKGALLFLASFVLATIWHLPLFILLIGRVLAAVDAHHIAARRRSGNTVSDGEWDLG